MYLENRKIISGRTFSRRIGGTVYEVHIYYDAASGESAEDKIRRLLKKEAANV